MRTEFSPFEKFEPENWEINVDQDDFDTGEAGVPHLKSNPSFLISFALLLLLILGTADGE